MEARKEKQKHNEHEIQKTSLKNWNLSPNPSIENQRIYLKEKNTRNYTPVTFIARKSSVEKS